MTDATQLQVELEREVTVLTPGTDYRHLDEPKVTLLGELLPPLLDEATPPLVVVDLSNVQFFGSSFIELLFRARNHLNNRSGRLAICGLQGYCREVVEVAHLDQLWLVCDDRPAAIEALLSGEEPAAG